MSQPGLEIARELKASGLFDPEHADEDNYSHRTGRKPFGRIAIANSDSGVDAMVQGAIELAHRAVEEIRL